MSIYVMITRHAHPMDDGGPAIEAGEWCAIADAASDFRRPASDEREWLGPHARVWVGDPRGPMFFDWVRGEVQVKDADEPIVARMQAIAGLLGARVFSETGELFDGSGESAGFLPGYP